MMVFNIVEIFQSLQGEGANTGMPAIFIRFAGCNLTCRWCDTDFNHYHKMTFAELLTEVSRYEARNIIITGGEPTLQRKLPALLTELKQRGYFIAIETNGLRPVDTQIDYIAVSPKFAFQPRYQDFCIPAADEMRIVVEDHPAFELFCLEMEQKITAKHYFLSPCEENGQFNVLHTITLLGKLNQRPNKPKWLLSLQTHKLAHIE
ncbi:7-carboxy-7-deazaguanine synthase QueE [Neisseriaceae bacterium ESL0693]|nr:7-carboxy-7-deazaguanine synthase QueE [Neisseriaceae bacterium ESL0693]